MADHPLKKIIVAEREKQAQAVLAVEAAERKAASAEGAARQRWPAVKQMLEAEIQAANDVCTELNSKVQFRYYEVPQPGHNISAGKLAIERHPSEQLVDGNVSMTKSGRLNVNCRVRLDEIGKFSVVNEDFDVGTVTPSHFQALFTRLYKAATSADM